MSTYKWGRVPNSRKVVELSSKDFGAKGAYESLLNIDNKLPESIKKSWRLLLLGALLDHELRLANGTPNQVINAAFQEVSDIQYLNNGHFFVGPPINSGESYPVKNIH